AYLLPVIDNALGSYVCVAVSGPRRGVVFFWEHELVDYDSKEPTEQGVFSSLRASPPSWTLSRSSTTPSKSGPTSSDLEPRHPLIPVFCSYGRSVVMERRGRAEPSPSAFSTPSLCITALSGISLCSQV